MPVLANFTDFKVDQLFDADDKKIPVHAFSSLSPNMILNTRFGQMEGSRK